MYLPAGEDANLASRVACRSWPARSGRGRISFGLVSVPVRMVGATESKELRFHFLDKHDLQPIGYDKVRRDTGEHVDNNDIVRGFEVEKGRFVPLEDEDLDRLDVELTKTIDICDFVDLDEIDPIYFRKAYYLLPQEGAEKPYRLLVRALDETGKVAIAKIVIRNKQHLAAVRPWNGVLVLETMYYADEVREPEKVDGRRAVAQARGRDGEVAGREPERRSSTRRSTTTPTARSCSTLLQREGGGQAAAGAARGHGRRGRRPDGGAARVGRERRRKKSGGRETR